jgi:hypothetical protein
MICRAVTSIEEDRNILDTKAFSALCGHATRKCAPPVSGKFADLAPADLARSVMLF